MSIAVPSHSRAASVLAGATKRPAEKSIAGRHRLSDDGRPQVLYPDFQSHPPLSSNVVASSVGYARHIGRVGALAVFLGVGVVLATGTGAGLAIADTDSGAAESSAADGAGSASAAEPSATTAPVVSAPTSRDAESAAEARHADAVPTMNYGSSGGAHTSAGAPAADDGSPEPATASATTPTRVESTRSATGNPSRATEAVTRERSSIVSSATARVEPRVEVSARVLDVAGRPSREPIEAAVPEPVVERQDAKPQSVEVQPIAVATTTLEQPATVATANFAAILSPFVLPTGPAAPAQSPLLWALFAMVRRDSLIGASRTSLGVNGSEVDAGTPSLAVAQPDRGPVAVDDYVTTTAGAPVTVAVLNNDSAADPISQLVKVTLVAGPRGGTVVVNPARAVTYTPAVGFTGIDEFSYTVTDSNGFTAMAKVRVTVLPVAVDDAFTTPRDTKLVVYDFDGVLANDNAFNGRLFVASTGTPAHGTVAVTEDGAVTYTPEKRFVGEDSFTYTVTDRSGVTATATVRVNVTAVPNQAPVATNDGYDTLENVPVAGNLLTNDEDPDGDSLTVRIVKSSEGTLVLGVGGAFTYIPPANNLSYDHGYEFTYEISDGRLTNQATVTFFITHVNVPPELVDDYATVVAGESIRIYPLLNDRDPDGDELYMFEVGPATYGQSDQGNVDFINYTAPDDFEGVDTFYYKVFDSANVVRTATVHVTVVPANRPPVAKDYTVTTSPGMPVRITVLADGLDPDEGDVLTVSLYQQPDRGNVVLNADGTFTYTPPAGVLRAQDFFTYEITDRSGRSDIGSVEVRIRPSNAAPVAGGNDYTVRPNAVLHVSADHGVLADDADPDGDYLTAAMVDGPRHGTIDFLADGSFTYTPNADFTGRDTFRYTAADSRYDSEIATVTIEVTASGVPEGVPGSSTGVGGSGIGECQNSWRLGEYAVPFAPVFCNAEDAWKARNLRRSL